MNHGEPPTRNSVLIYLDDILLKGSIEAEHLATLDKVLTKFETAGFKLKKNKHAVLLPAVSYLGHQISAEGLQPTIDKVRTIKQAPASSNVSQLRSFL